jgi:hypothetical protein
MTRKELHKNLVRYYSKITNSITTAPNIAANSLLIKLNSLEITTQEIHL